MHPATRRTGFTRPAHPKFGQCWQLFTLEYWAVMWSTYAALDPSYADTTTFGFNIDIGNGMSMIIPTLIFSIGMT